MKKLLWGFIYAYEKPVTIIRLFDKYGLRQTARTVTPTIITQMLSSNEIKIGSLQPRHDLTFVVDTMDAFIGFGELIDNGEVFNISSKMSVSVKEIIDIV